MSKLDFTDTIHILSKSHSAGDVWDEVNNDNDPYDMMFRFNEDTKYSIRFLGKFINVKRLYIPSDLLGKLISDEEVKTLRNTRSRDICIKVLKMLGAVNTNQGVDRIIHEVYTLNEGKNNTAKTRQVLIFLSQLMADETKWQSCVIANGFVKWGGTRPRTAAVPLTGPMMTKIFSNVASVSAKAKIKPDDMLISGLYAHDVIVKKGRRFDYDLRIDNKPSFLSDEAIASIINSGLVNIHELIGTLNKISTHRYLYSIPNNCRMSAEGPLRISELYDRMIEDQHFKSVDRSDPRELPDEAFGEEEIDNSIGYLEV